MSKRILLGKITAAHGIKGLVKVLVYAEDVTLLNGTLYTSDGGTDSVTLTMKNSMGKYWLAAVDGISDRTAAEKLHGTALWIDRDALPAPEDGEIYFEDMIGITVVAKDGSTIGHIIGVDDFGAGPLLDIKPESGASFYLPFADQYVLQTDIEGGVVTVEIPEGLR
ncbi:MAG: 16S rRNA processing protein RimM [Rhodospirillales bacterium]|nr:16S rRNA processing protein RimM [Rhodospirillales bacterium]